MSFILEALKKSEQQRQQENSPPRKARKRTLSLQAAGHSRRPYWLLAIAVLVLLATGVWWIFNDMEPSGEMNATVGRAAIETPAPVETTIAPTAEPTVQAREEAKPVVVAEPAPVPYASYIAEQSLPGVTQMAPADTSASTARNPELPELSPADVKSSQTTTAEQRLVSLSQEEPMSPPVAELPTYQELSRELRERLPRLVMSMHFFNNVANRRLVRINDQLLREGDWVSRDLELVEITPNGVILDYLGKGFELRSGER